MSVLDGPQGPAQESTVAEDSRIASQFFVGEAEIERVERFKYLGRIFGENNDNVYAVDN